MRRWGTDNRRAHVTTRRGSISSVSSGRIHNRLLFAHYHSNLGLAYAGLGRCEEAIREGEEAVRMVPISKDAMMGPELVNNLAEIYVKCGKYDAAIDQIETLLSVPSWMSPGLLRVDPIWDPLRS